MTTDFLKVGKAGERIARDFLRSRGMIIIASNFRTRLGEIDIVARDGETFVFVEVKTRTSTRFGAPFEAVTLQKISKLKMMVAIFASKNSLENFPQRLDVVGIILNSDFTAKKIEYFSGIAD